MPKIHTLETVIMIRDKGSLQPKASHIHHRGGGCSKNIKKKKNEA